MFNRENVERQINIFKWWGVLIKEWQLNFQYRTKLWDLFSKILYPANSRVVDLFFSLTDTRYINFIEYSSKKNVLYL